MAGGSLGCFRLRRGGPLPRRLHPPQGTDFAMTIFIWPGRVLSGALDASGCGSGTTRAPYRTDALRARGLFHIVCALPCVKGRHAAEGRLLSSVESTMQPWASQGRGIRHRHPPAMPVPMCSPRTYSLVMAPERHARPIRLRPGEPDRHRQELN
jgi:hypothetical protein